MAKRDPLWYEFIVRTPPKWIAQADDPSLTITVCGLCGNSGKIHQPVPGWDAHLDAFCLCPNGRALKQSASLRARLQALKEKKA